MSSLSKHKYIKVAAMMAWLEWEEVSCQLLSDVFFFVTVLWAKSEPECPYENVGIKTVGDKAKEHTLPLFQWERPPIHTMIVYNRMMCSFWPTPDMSSCTTVQNFHALCAGLCHCGWAILIPCRYFTVHDYFLLDKEAQSSLASRVRKQGGPETD